uniref:O-antigen/teichoic acid export membrane protein n=1 Tax=Streptomyces sp. NBC_00049 TaxID=2903617 RepID=A0AAU2JTQ3_9ACTN
MSRRGLAAVASVLDQAASSATNILVLVLAARLSSASGFADFSMVYVTFSVLLGLNMAYVGQTVVLEKGQGVPPDEVRGRLGQVCRSAVGFTGASSAAAGAVLAVVGLALPGDTGRAFLALGLVLPLVLVQDGLRYCFSALRAPERALAADALRLVCVVAALAVQPEGASAGRLVLVWGVSALPALCLGLWLLRPYVRGARAELRPYLRRGHLGQRFVVEFAVGNGSSQLAVLGLGVFATPLAVGALRGATTLFGPLNVLFNSANAFGPPIVGRASGKRGVVRLTALMGGVLALLGAGWGAVLYALPDRVGRALLGDTWAAASALLPATGAQYAVMGLGTCALLTLRVLNPKATLSLQVVFSLLSVGLLLGGYAAWGVTGAAWGLAAGSAAKAGAGWLRVSRLPAAAPSAEPVAAPAPSA